MSDSDETLDAQLMICWLDSTAHDEEKERASDPSTAPDIAMFFEELLVNVTVVADTARAAEAADPPNRRLLPPEDRLVDAP